MDRVQIDVEVADSEYCTTCEEFDIDYTKYYSRNFSYTKWYCKHYRTCRKFKEYLEREK